MKWLITGLGLGAGIGLFYVARNVQKSGVSVEGNTDDVASTTKQHRGTSRNATRTEGTRAVQSHEGGRQSEGIHGTQSSPENLHSPNLQQQGQKISEHFLTIVNEWPHARLIEIDGIGPILASKIISHRPYDSEQDLIDAKLLPPKAIEALRRAS